MFASFANLTERILLSLILNVRRMTKCLASSYAVQNDTMTQITAPIYQQYKNMPRIQDSFLGGVSPSFYIAHDAMANVDDTVFIKVI